VLVLLTAGCATFLSNAEKAEMSSFLVLDRYVALEKANGPALEKLVPGAHALANKIRAEAPDLLRAYDDALAAYRAVPNETTKAEVLRVMNVLMSLANSAQAIITRWQNGA
jgi:hypothetical protein